jgi:hypothetical protein
MLAVASMYLGNYSRVSQSNHDATACSLSDLIQMSVADRPLRIQDVKDAEHSAKTAAQ